VPPLAGRLTKAANVSMPGQARCRGSSFGPRCAKRSLCLFRHDYGIAFGFKGGWMCWHMSRAPPNEWQNIVIRGLIGIPLCQLEQLRDESNQSVQDCSVVVQNMLQKLKRLGRLGEGKPVLGQLIAGGPQ
jgi:hypothetical protein